MEESLKNIFPHLNSTNFFVTSRPDTNYNCVAWAIGLGPEDKQVWWPGSEKDGYIWPDGVPRELSIENFVLAFETLSYVVCSNGMLEEGYEKIAIYTLNNEPIHVAGQLPDGSWTSKLGRNEDINHTTLRALEGPIYGCVSVLMRRPRSMGK